MYTCVPKKIDVLFCGFIYQKLQIPHCCFYMQDFYLLCRLWGKLNFINIFKYGICYFYVFLVFNTNLASLFWLIFNESPWLISVL